MIDKLYSCDDPNCISCTKLEVLFQHAKKLELQRKGLTPDIPPSPELLLLLAGVRASIHSGYDSSELINIIVTFINREIQNPSINKQAERMH